VPNTD